jgi:hypothetical protein
MDEIYFYYPLVIDTTGYFVELIKWKYASRGVTLETTTPGRETLSRIKFAMREGHILILENFDQTLLDLVAPIIEVRYHNFQSHLRKTTVKWNKTSLIEKSDLQFQETINFGGEDVEISDFFHLVLISNDAELDLGNPIFAKVGPVSNLQLFFLNMDVEEEPLWKEFASDVIL